MESLKKYIDFSKLYETFEYEFGEILPSSMKIFLEGFLLDTWKVFAKQRSIDELVLLLKSNQDYSAQFPFNYEDLLIKEYGEDEVIDFDLENLFSDCVAMLFYARQIEIAQMMKEKELCDQKINRYNSAINEDDENVSYCIAFNPQ
ncbi:MAG: hypothetical protein R8N23_20015 [Reichenbachiella sp.]|uniref:hypothetical protein n=1 Tax=Reichenbachiella sp. TaxID=2184521 RepID=UPI0029661348|nr:hypothetical protein [Reichenbachiella sp.]MDW3212166.1 hypothetical protein [Reichenbachiella sp.]